MKLHEVSGLIATLLADYLTIVNSNIVRKIVIVDHAGIDITPVFIIIIIIFI